MTRKSRDILPLLTPRRRQLFQAKLVRCGDCLEFTGTRNHQGYGAMMFGASRLLAHRIAWTLANDREIAADRIICHRCNNPSCCNPKHLYEGTHQTNSDDARASRRTMQGRKGSNHPRGKSSDQRRQCILMRSEAIEFSVIAQELGIHRQTAERWWAAHVHAFAIAHALRSVSA